MSFWGFILVEAIPILLACSAVTDQDVFQTVAVEVPDSEPGWVEWVIQIHGTGVKECPIAAVQEKHVGRVGLHQDEIEVTIVVEISEGGCFSKLRPAQLCAGGYVLESQVSKVLVEDRRPLFVNNKNVHLAVVIVIPYDSLRAGSRKSHSRGDCAEGAVAVVDIKNVGAVVFDKIDVGPAITVKVG